MRKISTWIILLLIFVSILFRFIILPNHVQFDWDQENSVAIPAWEIIVNHKLPLVGAKTGIGDLRIGPLYSYLAAIFFVFFKGNPIGFFYLASTLAFLHLIIGFYLIRNIFDQKTAIFYTLLYSTSTYLFGYDQVTWNVNLLPIATLLLVLGQYLVNQKNLQRGFLLIGIGIFLAINAHYSLIFLIGAIIILNFFNKTFFNKYFLWVIFGTLIGIAPLLIFDFRHNHILLNNGLNLSSGQTSLNILFLITRFRQIVVIILETIARIFIYNGESWIQKTMGLSIFVYLLINQNKITKPLLKILFLNIGIYLIGFSIYKNQIPDYYFLSLLPTVILLISLSLKNTKNLIFILLIVFVNLQNTYALIFKINPDSLQAKQEIVQAIKNNSKNEEVSINFDMPLGKNFGFNYLFDYYNVKISKNINNEKMYWISYPEKRIGVYPDFTSGNYALALPQKSKSILISKGISFYNGMISSRIPNNWTTISCPTNDKDIYLLTENKYQNCANLENISSGILISNPDCSLIEEKLEYKLKIKTYLSFKYFEFTKENNEYDFLKNKQILGFKTADQRCLGFINMNNQTETDDPNFSLFLESLKQ